MREVSAIMSTMLSVTRTRNARLLIACIATGLISAGCGSDSLREYHVVERSAVQRVAIPAASKLEDDQVVSAPISAMTPENSLSIAGDNTDGTNSVAETIAPISALEIANPRRVELLVPHKTFPTDRKTGALRLTYDDLNLFKVLNMEPVTSDAVSWMPEWMTSLNGKRVRIRGFMFPSFMAEDLDRFVLLRDNQACCYGPGAKVYDFIEVHMQSGTTTNYIPLNQAFDVVGRLKIDLQFVDSSIYALYFIEEAAVLIR